MVALIHTGPLMDRARQLGRAFAVLCHGVDDRDRL